MWLSGHSHTGTVDVAMLQRKACFRFFFVGLDSSLDRRRTAQTAFRCRLTSSFVVVVVVVVALVPIGSVCRTLRTQRAFRCGSFSVF